MKKIWDEEDSNLYHQGHFIAEGLMRYWESIVNAVQFNENIQQAMRENQLKKAAWNGGTNYWSKFTWKRKQESRWDFPEGRSKLPRSPPPKD